MKNNFLDFKRLFIYNFKTTFINKMILISSIAFIIISYCFNSLYYVLNEESVVAFFNNLNFNVYIMLSVTYAIILNTHLFIVHKKNNFLKFEQHSGVSFWISFYVRLLIAICIAYIYITILIIANSLLVFLSRDQHLFVNFVFLPSLSLYFFCLVFICLSVCLIVFIKQMWAFISITTIAVMIMSLNYLIKIFGLVGMSDIDIAKMNSTSKSFELGSRAAKIILKENPQEQFLDKYYENNKALAEFFNNPQFTADSTSYENSKFFGRGSFVMQDYLFEYQAYIQQTNTGLIYSWGKDGAWKTTFDDTAIGDIIARIKFIVLSNPEIFTPDQNSRVMFFDQEGTQKKYDFIEFLNKLRQKFDANYFDFFNLIEECYSLAINDSLSYNDKLIYRKSLKMLEKFRLPAVSQEFINLYSGLYEKQVEENKQYHDNPGLAIINNILFNLQILIYHSNQEFDGVADYHDGLKQSATTNQANLLDHFKKIYQNNINNNYNYNFLTNSASSSLVKLDKETISNFANDKNQNNYWSDHNLEYQIGFNLYWAVSCYSIFFLSLTVLGCYIFKRNSQI